MLEEAHAHGFEAEVEEHLVGVAPPREVDQEDLEEAEEGQAEIEQQRGTTDPAAEPRLPLRPQEDGKDGAEERVQQQRARSERIEQVQERERCEQQQKQQHRGLGRLSHQPSRLPRNGSG